MVYHYLRTAGRVPLTQLGMNVKMWINDPTSELFQELGARKHEDYKGGFEPIPDVVIFDEGIAADWRRRNYLKTLKHMLVAIEVKASERANGRLRPGEILKDILKLAAHREEAHGVGSVMYPVMMIIDSAPIERERMTDASLEYAADAANRHEVGFMYVGQQRNLSTV